MFIWDGEREGELGNTDKKVGDKRVKVAGEILLLEPVELTLTMSLKPNQVNPFTIKVAQQAWAL